MQGVSIEKLIEMKTAKKKKKKKRRKKVDNPVNAAKGRWRHQRGIKELRMETTIRIRFFVTLILVHLRGCHHLGQDEAVGSCKQCYILKSLKIRTLCKYHTIPTSLLKCEYRYIM